MMSQIYYFLYSISFIITYISSINAFNIKSYRIITKTSISLDSINIKTSSICDTRSNRLDYLVLYAKRDRQKNQSASKGFKRQTESMTSGNSIDNNEVNNQQVISNELEDSPNKKNINNDITDEASLFQKYGIQDGSSSKEKSSKKKVVKSSNNEEEPFGQSVLAKIPVKLQVQIDRFLLTGTFVGLGLIILNGIGISIGAFKVVFPSIVIPTEVDTIVKDGLIPLFTPSVVIFFFFSITLGLFKLAQIGSASTTYSEK